MKRFRSSRRDIFIQASSSITPVLLAAIACLMLSCSKPPVQPKTMPSPASDIKVEVRDGGPVVVTTKTAEFQVSDSGAVQATLLKDGKRLTLDDTGSTAASDYVTRAGHHVQFTPDPGKAKVLEATGKLGRGKRVETAGRS